MNVLFLHRYFPGHYPHVAAALAADPRNRVVFVTETVEGRIPGVTPLIYRPARPPHRHTHPYLRSLEAAVLSGQAVYRTCTALKESGFRPDVVCAHSGFGPSLYVREAFPDTPLLGYFEWYYRGQDSDADYLDPAGTDPDTACTIRTRNAPLLLDLAQCVRGVSPTRFQRDQFPAEFRSKLTVLHDGIDTDAFRPQSGAEFVLPGVDPSGVEAIVTYATRGMEPYRGFPQFMRAAALLLRRRPRVHVVIAGSDIVCYGRRLPDGRTYKQRMLAELPDLDRRRLHFVGPLPLPHYRRLLQASSVHVYLTVPFVLSWSLLEAMATGCLVVASDTAPVREVIEDGRDGLLADFFSPEAICARIEQALGHPDRMAAIRAAARRRIVRHYALKTLLPRHLQLIHQVAEQHSSTSLEQFGDAVPNQDRSHVTSLFYSPVM